MRNKRVFAVKVETDPHEALLRAVYERGALEASAQAIGVSHQTLSKKLNELDGQSLSLRKATAINDFLDPGVLARTFAARAHGVFVQLPEAHKPEVLDDLHRGFAKFVQEFAESTAAFSALVRDGRVTQPELDRFHKEFADVVVAGEQLLTVAQAMVREEKRQ